MRNVMIEGYTTVKDIAEKWNITKRTVQIMCSEGKIEGAVKFGDIWAIPISAKKPIDKRITTGNYIDSRKKGYVEKTNDK